MQPQPLATFPTDAFAADVHAGLSRSGQKELPSKYLYDAVGSGLFEVITDLPEYGLTRAEERILQAHSGDICALAGQVEAMVELGSGSGRKTRLLLEAWTRQHRRTALPTLTSLAYYPVEISSTALAQCQAALSDIPGVNIIGLERDYLAGVKEAVQRRSGPQPILVLFLGSTIGNFKRLAALHFLSEIRALLRPGDTLLFGADLDKPRDQLLRAYDDPLGVTACFNLNLLARINRELGGNFDLKKFRHEARVNAESHAVEMHLRAMISHQVAIPGAGLHHLSFEAGETIWTESSHKYEAEDLRHMGASAGFATVGQWIDTPLQFAETLLRVV